MTPEPSPRRPIGTDQLTLVPPARLGRVLGEARERAGAGRDALAAASGGEFTVADLAAVESGIVEHDVARLERLLELYAADPSELLPGRAELVIDLDAGTVAAGSYHGRLDAPADRPDDVLARYLAFVYEMRGLPSGTPIPVRTVDLEVLAATLRLPTDDIAGRLDVLMAEPAGLVDRWRERLSRRVLVAGAAAVIAVGVAGVLVLSGGDDTAVIGADAGTRVAAVVSAELTGSDPDAADAPQPAPTPEADVPEVGDPLVVENPADAPQPAPTPEADVPEIGDPLVVENPGAEAPAVDAPGGPLVVDESAPQPAPTPEADVPEIGDPLVVENDG